MKLDFKSLVLFEDDNFLVANKPPYISSLDDRNNDVNLQMLAKRYDESLSACHRLDKETSGCLLFAKNAEAYRHASIQFEKRTVDKVYHAFVNGIHEFRNLKVELPILSLNKGSVVIDFKGKPATTIFNTLEVYKRHSLIECRPETGRMHQIRIHLSKKEAPIINDPLYGGAPLFLSEIKKKFNLGKYEEEQPLIKRFALHAFALSFRSLNNEEVTVQAGYPKDLRVIEKQLKANRY
ncbi:MULTISPECIES: RluA family pseudouridine synthase [Roseivirga]|nr:RluA family pseudouridine synthase [Roseivirga spongicola]WPZ10864.1 RluA family pseudouridine synthase [Roseivirga spongicola]